MSEKRNIYLSGPWLHHPGFFFPVPFIYQQLSFFLFSVIIREALSFNFLLLLLINTETHSWSKGTE